MIEPVQIFMASAFILSAGISAVAGYLKAKWEIDNERKELKNQKQQ